MKRLLTGIFTLLTALMTGAATLTGVWSGTLPVGGGLRLVIHIDGASRCVTLDSPQQGASDIKTQVKWLSADSLNFSVPGLMLNFAGRLSDGVLNGTFRQSGVKLPLTLTRTEALSRPQTPRPPFPYTTTEFSIVNPEGNALLSGTLTLPEGEKAEGWPLVVMVSGSGQQNRDEEIAGHKPFAVIADRLARRGIASFRYDDRGVGASTGEVADCTTADFASDAAAVVEALKKDGRFSSTGVLGHSEGALIGMMLAASDRSPDFLICVAGPALKGSDIIGAQNTVSLLDAGADSIDARICGEAIGKALYAKALAKDYKVDPDETVSKLLPDSMASQTRLMVSRQLRKILAEEPSNPWMMYFLRLDPADYLSRVSIPVFMAYGGLDTQVEARENVPMAGQLSPAAIIKEYPGLNHLMQHAATGRTSEYYDIPETFSEEVIADIIDFLSAL